MGSFFSQLGVNHWNSLHQRPWVLSSCIYSGLIFFNANISRDLGIVANMVKPMISVENRFHSLHRLLLAFKLIFFTLQSTQILDYICEVTTNSTETDSTTSLCFFCPYCVFFLLCTSILHSLHAVYCATLFMFCELSACYVYRNRFLYCRLFCQSLRI